MARTILCFVILIHIVSCLSLFAQERIQQKSPETTGLQHAKIPDDAGLPAVYTGKVSLYVLAGQSNMSGRAKLPESQSIHPRIFVFGNDYRWRPASEPIDDASRQVDRVSVDSLAGFSPALSFARALAEMHPQRIIGLIPCAKGATSMHRWQRDLNDQTLYGSCLKRIRAASTIGTLEGVLFYQGESDALDPAQYPQRILSASDWAKNFSRFVWALRADVGKPDLVVVFAQLASTTRPRLYPNWQTVMQQQASIDIPGVIMVRTRDLELSDYVHLSTEGYQILGRRFAKAMSGLEAE